MNLHIVCLCSSFDAFSLHTIALSSTVFAMLVFYVATILAVFRRNVYSKAPQVLYTQVERQEPAAVVQKKTTKRPFDMF